MVQRSRSFADFPDFALPRRGRRARAVRAGIHSRRAFSRTPTSTATRGLVSFFVGSTRPRRAPEPHLIERQRRCQRPTATMPETATLWSIRPARSRCTSPSVPRRASPRAMRRLGGLPRALAPSTYSQRRSVESRPFSVASDAREHERSLEANAVVGGSRRAGALRAPKRRLRGCRMPASRSTSSPLHHSHWEPVQTRCRPRLLR